MITMKLIPAVLSGCLLVPSALGEEDEAERLRMLFVKYDQWYLREHPEEAMKRGDYTNADRVTDHSLAAVERRHQDLNQFLVQLNLVDQSRLAEGDLVSFELFETTLSRQIDGHRFRTFLVPMNARSGPQITVPQMGDHVRFDTVEDYVNYVQRLQQVPRSIRDTIALMQLGIEEGRVPPKVVMEGVPDQFAALLDEGKLDRLGEPFDRMPKHIMEEQRKIVRMRFDQVALPAVRDALADLRRFVENEYIARCRDTIAATDWPDGEAYYAFALRTMTTTDLSAQEIHDLGRAEVARIRGEMMDVIRSSDYMEVNPEASALDDDALFDDFIGYLRTDERFYHRTAEDLLAGYRAICKEIDGHMPRLFGRLPRLPYGVKPIPPFMAPRATTAYYQSGDLRNAEAGYFYANTYGLDKRPRYEMIPLALHEAVPGHHHQIALAKEIDGLPEFRKEAWFTVFGEGWALYAESLGLDMGLFEDPYDDFGRLLYEMWRACRLVVDPGLHALGWSRRQAIDFMLANTALSELNIINEVDRYIAWPAQATAYKIGELKIRGLRSRAEAALGAGFDLRGFHDVVLEAGSVPLSVLERRVEEWMNRIRLEGMSYD